MLVENRAMVTVFGAALAASGARDLSDWAKSFDSSV
jgi:hypothetical protein